MTQGRPIHDCPYCGRTKFADETLPCCSDDFFAMRLEWQRQKDARDDWGKPQETWNRELRMFITESEIFSQ